MSDSAMESHRDNDAQETFVDCDSSLDDPSFEAALAQVTLLPSGAAESGLCDGTQPNSTTGHERRKK